jgi:hypothetical protein
MVRLIASHWTSRATSWFKASNCFLMVCIGMLVEPDQPITSERSERVVCEAHSSGAIERYQRRWNPLAPPGIPLSPDAVCVPLPADQPRKDSNRLLQAPDSNGSLRLAFSVSYLRLLLPMRSWTFLQRKTPPWCWAHAKGLCVGTAIPQPCYSDAGGCTSSYLPLPPEHALRRSCTYFPPDQVPRSNQLLYRASGCGCFHPLVPMNPQASPPINTYNTPEETHRC